jgi:molybdate transport system substrate-binding protein
MKTSLRTTAGLLLGLAAVSAPIASLKGAELQILAGGAMAEPLRQLATQFESASGHKLVLRFGTTPELIKLATTGGPFDLGVFPEDVLKDVAARAQFAPGPATGIARVGLGVAVRSGAPRPDISTPDALKQTLLKARTIATIPASATGTQLLQVFEVLGISEAMKPKIRPQATPAQIVQTVASGEVELAVFVMNVLKAPGLDVVGPFPAEVQRQVVFTAAVAANTKQSQAAKAFITYLTSPAAVAVLKAKGMDQ